MARLSAFIKVCRSHSQSLDTNRSVDAWFVRTGKLTVPSGRVPSGKYTVRFYAIVCDLSASMEPQSAPPASKRFGAIPPGHFFTNALPSKYPVHGSTLMCFPKALYSVLLNSIMLIPSTSVVHFV